MIKDLVKIASELDRLGLKKEADTVDSIIRKIAQKVIFPKNPPTRVTEWIQVTTEPSFEYLCENYSGYSSKPLSQQVKEQEELNKLNVPGFDKANFKRGMKLVMYSPGVMGP